MTNPIGSPEPMQYGQAYQLAEGNFDKNYLYALKDDAKSFILHSPSPLPALLSVPSPLNPLRFSSLDSNHSSRATPPAPSPRPLPQTMHHIFQQTAPLQSLLPSNNSLVPTQTILSDSMARQLRDRSLLKRKDYKEPVSSTEGEETDSSENTDKKPKKKRAKILDGSSIQNKFNQRKLSNRKAAQRSRLAKKMGAEIVDTELKNFDLFYQEIGQIYDNCIKGNEIGCLVEEKATVKQGLTEKQVALLRFEQRNEIRKMFVQAAKDLAEKRAYIAQLESRIAP